MKSPLALAAICCLFVSALTIPPQPPLPTDVPSEIDNCPRGPGYWCQNLGTAKECHATKHCIQTIWVHKKLPPDYSSVCQTCLDMVKMARDQLLSNETQEEIKEVFEGSCKLLPIDIVKKECIKLADEFLPELVDTLASEMNPQMVCSVAGLCNNANIQTLIAQENKNKNNLATVQTPMERCEECQIVINIVDKKFRAASRDQVLQGILSVCGEMGSFSDGCSAIVIRYFYNIYDFLNKNLNAVDFCLMSGECSGRFHIHANVEITPLSNFGVVPVKNDDLPCDLCLQLIQHLRDILIANTTESEFRQVLIGICKQTGSFKNECTDIVQQYYSDIYDFLVNKLNGKTICSLIQICPAPGQPLDGPIQPLVPVETAKKFEAFSVIPKTTADPLQVINHPETMQLPIERVVPQTLTMIGDTEKCVFCEYFLHFVQNALTDPKTEKQIKQVVDRACNELPNAINATCQAFVNTYGPAFIAILAQEIDPSVVCPKLSLCPAKDSLNVEVFMHHDAQDKPNCPMCLFAILSLEEYIKNDRTEANIRKGLGVLCSHLRPSLREECKDLVQTYSEEIVDSLMNSLKPGEVCEFLKLCKDPRPAPTTTTEANISSIRSHPKLARVSLERSETIAKGFSKKYMPIEYGGHVATNEIPDFTANGQVVEERVQSSVCVLCEFVMSQIRQELQDNSTSDEIKTIVHNVCHHLPKSVKSECDSFVDEYADAVIEMLIQSLDPSQICTELKMCKPSKSIVAKKPLSNKLKSPQCSLCKIVMVQLEKILDGDITEAKVINAMDKVCSIIPYNQRECNDFVNKYGKRIVELLKLAVQPAEICSLLFFCQEKFEDFRQDVRQCSVCMEIAANMETLMRNPNIRPSKAHILKKTCHGLRIEDRNMCQNMMEQYGQKLFNKMSNGLSGNLVCPLLNLCGKSSQVPELLGKERCTWGPSYWCSSRAVATTCGAVKHCEDHVWKSSEEKAE